MSLFTFQAESRFIAVQPNAAYLRIHQLKTPTGDPINLIIWRHHPRLSCSSLIFLDAESRQADEPLPFG